MPNKIVDVIVDGKVLISYPITHGIMNAPSTDDDFIQMAKENLVEDDYSKEIIASATFRVRDP